MDSGTARRIERLTDHASAGCLSGAIAFAIFHLPEVIVPPFALAAYAIAAAGIAYLASWRLLGRVAPFAANSPTPSRLREELTNSPEIELPVSATGSSAGVVHLFESAASSAAEQAGAFHVRMAKAVAPAAPTDASESLYEALNQLRRSLR